MIYENYAVVMNINGKPVILGLFDTAGQEDYDRLRPLYYPQTDVFLLCFSLVNRPTFENVKYQWYPEIKHHCPDTPFFLVGTELETRNDPLIIERFKEIGSIPITYDEGLKLSREIGALGYYECSCYKQETCKPVFDAVALSYLGLPFKSMKEIECEMILTRGLQEGYVFITSMKLVIMGPPCVGKTAFKSLLFNWSPPKSHHSTAIAARPIRAIERVAERNEGKIWEMITGSELLKMLSDAMRALDDPANVENYPSKNEEYPKNDDTSKTSLEYVDHSAAIATSKINTVETTQPEGLSSSSASPTAIDNTTEEVTSKSKLIPNVDAYSQDILSFLASRKKSEQLHKATWIHLLDSGGQPQFADISRAFLRGNVVNIIVTKLTEGLSDKPCFFYSLNGKILNQPTELQMTNLQLIEHFVRSLAASKNTIVGEGKKAITSKPRFVIVGTYLDQTKSMFKKQVVKESLDEKNAQLLSTLADFRDYLIFYNDTSNELIFPVDNLCRFNRKKISSAIRQRIMSQENVGITVPIPVRWYMFEINTKDEASKEDHGIISLKSCYDIGMKLGMERSEVENCVSYLDSLTLFLSFRKVLPNVIFTNPQYLLDTLSAFVRFSFVDSVSDILPNSSSALRHVQRVLREDGVFEEFLLDELSLTFVPSVFTKEDLLKLLEYLNIIAPLTTSDSVKRYFIPIVLPPCQMTEEDKTSFKRSCDPVIIEFTNKVVPQGMFPAVVVAMLDRKHKPHFFLDSRSRSFPRQLRYGIKLYSDDLLGSILLVDCFYWIEVYFTGLPENCPILRQVIKEAISSCAELLDYDVKSVEIEVTLPCLEKHKVDDDKLHGVIIKYNQGRYIAKCPVESEITFEVTDKRQLCWFKVSSSLALPVSLPDGHLDESHLPGLLYAVREVYQWDILGTFLGILDSILQTINVNNHYQVEPSRKDMLIQWVNGGNASKAALIEALKNMKLQRIISELESTTV